MEKISLERFVELAGCSKQLISNYNMKGMPKHPDPNDKRKSLYDLKECRDWAWNKGHKRFHDKIDLALVKQCGQGNLTYTPDHTPEPQEDPELDFCEGSTAPKLEVRINKLNELRRRFDAFMEILEECVKEAE